MQNSHQLNDTDAFLASIADLRDPEPSFVTTGDRHGYPRTSGIDRRCR